MRNKPNRDKRILREVERIANSPNIEQFLAEAEKVKPWTMRFFGEGTVRRSFMPSIGNYSDSLRLPGQKPALFAILDLFENNRDAKILYVASSYGLGMKLIQEAGYDVVGVDIDKRAIDFCSRNGLDVRNVSALSTGFPGEFFDAVISRDFIVADYPPGVGNAKRAEFLNEQYRVLRKGGKVVFTTLMPHSHASAAFPPFEAIGGSKLSRAEEEERLLKVEIPGRGIVDYSVRYYTK